MKNKLILTLLFSQIALAQGYSTNIPIRMDNSEIFENVMIKAEANYSSINLKEMKQDNISMIDFADSERKFFLNVDYSRLNKEDKEKKQTLANYKDRNYINTQLIYRPEDTNCLIGYEYKGISDYKDVHSLILGYTYNESNFFLNPYIQKNKYGKDDDLKGINLETIIRLPLESRIYGILGLDFLDHKKEFTVGLYSPYNIEITDNQSIDLNFKIKFSKAIDEDDSKDKDNEIRSQKFFVGLEPKLNLTENIYIKGELGYTTEKYKHQEHINQFNYGVGFGIKL